MAKNWGRTPVTNADKRFAAPIKYFVETPDGVMQRIERRPLGASEQFVDKDGNIVRLTMYGDGDSQKATTEQRNRMMAHRKEQIEYARCPLRHGTRQYAQRDFAKMPRISRANVRAIRLRTSGSTSTASQWPAAATCTRESRAPTSSG
jgi:hypothetical protein